MTTPVRERTGWRASLADLFYPRQCTVCLGPPDPGFQYLCWDCLASVEWLHAPMCSQCGEPAAGRIDGAYVCHLCTEVPKSFDRARSAARYEGAVADAIQQLKYQKGLWLADDLAGLLASCAETHYEVAALDALVPVPLHPARRRRRGFNQAGILAHCLGRRLGLPVVRRGLRRILPTASQTNLTARDRASNVKNAFVAGQRKQVQDRHLLLIDDVMTTGATVSECARILKEAGAIQVDVVTVARG